jgi:hypothetical protein
MHAPMQARCITHLLCQHSQACVDPASWPTAGSFGPGHGFAAVLPRFLSLCCPSGSAEAAAGSSACTSCTAQQAGPTRFCVLLSGGTHQVARTLLLLLVRITHAAAAHILSLYSAAITVWLGSVRMTHWGRKSHLSDSGVQMPVGYGSMPATEFSLCGTESMAAALVMLQPWIQCVDAFSQAGGCRFVLQQAHKTRGRVPS